MCVCESIVSMFSGFSGWLGLVATFVFSQWLYDRLRRLIL